MKKIFILTLSAVSLNAVAPQVQAQDGLACFMLDANGKPLDLGYLCQNSHSKSNYPALNLPQPTQLNQAGVHVVPIKRKLSGIPVIDVKFNHKYTFEMMLDTGASSVVITRSMARILNVNHHETVLVSTPSNNNVKLSSGYVYSVQVAGITHGNTRVITAPTMDIGLLGQSFFNRYDLTIKSDVVEFRER